jgi:hypothetical protein
MQSGQFDEAGEQRVVVQNVFAQIGNVRSARVLRCGRAGSVGDGRVHRDVIGHR